MLRKVMVMSKRRDPVHNIWVHYDVGEALFHQWMQESSDGDMSVVAVVEYPDGKVDTPYVHNIRFLDKPQEAAVNCSSTPSA